MEKINPIDAFRDEWQQIPLNSRYLIVSGIFLIFNSWLLDHWRPNNQLPFLFWGLWDIRTLSYSTGFSLILIVSFIFLIKRLFNLGNIVKKYRGKYPIGDVGRTYSLVWFSGKLILFDEKEKKYYHIYPWETAQDLEFVSYGTHVKDSFPNPINKMVVLDNGQKLNVLKYSNGGSINTQK